VDPTVDLVLTVSPDFDHQTDGQDFSIKGHWKDRPAFPGLTLSVAEASYYGTGQGMEAWIPPLAAPSVAESSPRAVALPVGTAAHPPFHSREVGASPDDFPSDILLQQEQSDTSATANTETTGTTLI